MTEDCPHCAKHLRSSLDLLANLGQLHEINMELEQQLKEKKEVLARIHSWLLVAYISKPEDAGQIFKDLVELSAQHRE